MYLHLYYINKKLKKTDWLNPYVVLYTYVVYNYLVQQKYIIPYQINNHNKLNINENYLKF